MCADTGNVGEGDESHRKRKSGCEETRNHSTQPLFGTPGQTEEERDDPEVRGLEYLFSKQLSHSDSVRAVGRLVIPKSVAESLLPPLTPSEPIKFLNARSTRGLSIRLRFRRFDTSGCILYLFTGLKEFYSRVDICKGDIIDFFMGKDMVFVLRLRKWHPNMSKAENQTGRRNRRPKYTIQTSETYIDSLRRMGIKFTCSNGILIEEHAVPPCGAEMAYSDLVRYFKDMISLPGWEEYWKHMKSMLEQDEALIWLPTLLEKVLKTGPSQNQG